jgi:hypothetical protein
LSAVFTRPASAAEVALQQRVGQVADREHQAQRQPQRLAGADAEHDQQRRQQAQPHAELQQRFRADAARLSGATPKAMPRNPASMPPAISSR